jgi:hypothetical protein
MECDERLYCSVLTKVSTVKTLEELSEFLVSKYAAVRAVAVKVYEELLCHPIV